MAFSQGFSHSHLDALSEKYGESFYIFDCDNFLGAYSRLLGAFRERYSNTNIAYSYKTNYLPRICSLVEKQGGYAETVSSMEIKLATDLGIEPNRIFYNGPYKERETISELLHAGGIVNADNFSDLNTIISLAQKMQSQVFRVGLRCNFPISDGVRSRFGFDVSGGDLRRAFDLVSKADNVKLSSLHCHFASRELRSWNLATSGMIEVLEGIGKAGRRNLEFVSLGGGLFGDMDPHLANQLNIKPPSFLEYAEVSAGVFSDYLSRVEQTFRPELLIEPGTALAANCLKFIAKVYDIKKVEEKFIATVAGSSFNITPTSREISLPMKVVCTKESLKKEGYVDLDIAGYTCIEQDYLYRGYSGKIGIGDYVIFDSAGSYSIVMKPPFILPNVPIIEIMRDGRSMELKRQETASDVFQGYKMKFDLVS